MTEPDVYQMNGYKNRQDYLNSLADEHALPEKVVELMANMLGPEEDFDGLVALVEDASASGEFDY
ncbi:RNA polymerase [Priestia megaterium]|uniref:RNA polymerase n=1 Tax=Priestia megaterium TaxID=1404 RepID=A0A6H1P754_PRIMG|nr:RNA polymerase [Priestia megaterium]QIZ09373.1 RNA polymerase [Priestia megaterium]